MSCARWYAKSHEMVNTWANIGTSPCKCLSPGRSFESHSVFHKKLWIVRISKIVSIMSQAFSSSKLRCEHLFCPKTLVYPSFSNAGSQEWCQYYSCLNFLVLSRFINLSFQWLVFPVAPHLVAIFCLLNHIQFQNGWSKYLDF